MLNGSFHIESLLAGALIAALPLLTSLSLVRRSYQRAIATLKKEAQLQKEEASAQVNRLNEVHALEITALQETHAKAVEEARGELSIVSFPYEYTRGDDGWLVDDRTAEVGYQYQLFIRGVPCFEPHKVVTQRIEKKEVNQEKLMKLKGEVVDLLTTIASRHPAFQMAQKFALLGTK